MVFSLSRRHALRLLRNCCLTPEQARWKLLPTLEKCGIAMKNLEQKTDISRPRSLLLGQYGF